MLLSNFDEVISKYKVVFFDAFGVLKNYEGMIPDIKKTFEYLEQQQIDYYVLTNDASRSPEDLAKSYIKNNIPEITADKVISSGMLAREYLHYKVNDGVVTYLGTANSAHYIETAGLKTIALQDLDMAQAEEVNALVILDDEGYEWQPNINKAVNLLRQHNMPVIVANTDATYPVSRHEVAIASGAIADMIETIVRKNFIRFGKPGSQMFRFAYEYASQKQEGLNKNDVLMVGDSLSTDIMGGNKFGIDTALVLTGNTIPSKADLLIESMGIIPTYICDSAVI